MGSESAGRSVPGASGVRTPSAVQILRLQVENVRCLGSAELNEPGAINVLAGPNGAGKTSVLEAMHLLGTARSFRSRQVASVMRRGARYFRVTGVVDSGDGGAAMRMGVAREEGRLLLRCGGEDVRLASSLARILPLMVIRPESHELFAGSPEERRRALDWLVFHVEPGFAGAVVRYLRALKQRNAALRAGGTPRQVAVWDEALASSGEAVAGLREAVFLGLADELGQRLASLVGQSVSVELRRGWSAEETLLAALRSNHEQDRERGVTQRGPHRADLRFAVDGVDARQLLSRGEGKRVVLALLLAMAAHVGRCAGRLPVLLVDDLASELDASARARFLIDVASLGSQVFITTVDEALVGPAFLGASTLFHVKQGQLVRVI